MVILLFVLIGKMKRVLLGQFNLPQDPVTFLIPTWQFVFAVHLFQTAQPDILTMSEDKRTQALPENPREAAGCVTPSLSLSSNPVANLLGHCVQVPCSPCVSVSQPYAVG